MRTSARLFEDLTTDEERRHGFIATEELLERCLAAGTYELDGADGVSVCEVAIEGYYSVSYTHLTLPTKRIV